MLSLRLLVKPCLAFICLSLFFLASTPCWAQENYLDIWQLKSVKVWTKGPAAEANSSKSKTLDYTVRKGDTLWRLAKTYQVDLDLLMKVNKISEPEKLQIGTRIIIPQNEGALTDNTQLAARSRGSSFLWPVEGVITSRFGMRHGSFHHGLDIAAKAGTAVKAIDAGKVIFSGFKNWVYGSTVIIDHGGGIKAIYAHNRKNLVKEGDWVKVGQAIAEVGSTGRSTGPHVHLEIHVDDQPVNPLLYLRER